MLLIWSCLLACNANTNDNCCSVLWQRSSFIVSAKVLVMYIKLSKGELWCVWLKQTLFVIFIRRILRFSALLSPCLSSLRPKVTLWVAVMMRSCSPGSQSAQPCLCGVQWASRCFAFNTSISAGWHLQALFSVSWSSSYGEKVSCVLWDRSF